MNIRRIFFMISSACLLLPLSGRAESLTDSLFRVYDRDIANAQQYFDIRQKCIDSICKLPESAQRMIEIGELYRPYQCDSSLLYYMRALENGDALEKKEAHIRLVYLLASIGFYNEGFLQAESIGIVPEDLKDAYYSAMNRLYGESSAYSKTKEYKAECAEMAEMYEDSLLQTLRKKGEPSVTLYKFDLVAARDEKDYDMALLYSDSALSMVPEYSHDYAIIAYETAIIYRSMGDDDSYRQWLLRSAIADVRCGITDNGSSWMLARMVFDDGKTDRAYRYIEYSLANAGRFNAQLRYVQINPLGLMINKAYQSRQQTLSRHLIWALGSLIVVLLILLCVVVYTIHQNRRLNALYEKQGLMNAELNTLNVKLSSMNADLSSLNLSLQEASLVKEQYICRYLEVYSEYIRRLTQMARKAGVKDPDAFNNKEMAEFYRSFDNTFLSIYRSFVTDFNALLKPEERIVPKQGELLTTELRIFALIRLGIDSSSKIAELLCYSPNTIYNYRARVKNGALGDREDFENKVRQLGSITVGR